MLNIFLYFYQSIDSYCCYPGIKVLLKNPHLLYIVRERTITMSYFYPDPHDMNPCTHHKYNQHSNFRSNYIQHSWSNQHWIRSLLVIKYRKQLRYCQLCFRTDWLTPLRKLFTFDCIDVKLDDMRHGPPLYFEQVLSCRTFCTSCASIPHKYSYVRVYQLPQSGS